MMCHCSREQFMFEENMSSPEIAAAIEMSAGGLSAKTIEGEAKLDEGNIEEAESSLREALSLNFEEARALLGKLEYQRGNVEAALQVFDGIDVSSIVPRMRFSLTEKGRHRRGRSRTDSTQYISLHAASLLLEAIYLKAKSLEKLGRLKEAAGECKNVLDTIDAALPHGMPEAWGESKLQGTVSKAVELMPELYKECGLYEEAILSYRRALLNPWNLDSECSGRIQKNFAVLLLYGGIEAGSPMLGAQIEGAFTPKNNIEEAILLLMILLRKNTLKKVPWDHTIMEHLSYALCICGQPQALAHQFEEVLPGTYSRTDRWYSLSLCYSAAGDNRTAVNLLKKSLAKVESPHDVPSLVLASKLCAADPEHSKEAVEYGRTAIGHADGKLGYLRARANHVLGVALSTSARSAASDSERNELGEESMKALQKAALLEKEDPYIVMDLGLECAERGDLSRALECAKQYLELSCGACVRGWRFLALVLSAQKRHHDAEIVVNAALDETGKWEQGMLLRSKAKLQIAQGQRTNAIQTYMLLLALLQAQRKSTASSTSGNHTTTKNGDSCLAEMEVWHDLAGVYTSLSQWRDAELCLEKAQSFRRSSAATWFATGALCEARGNMQDAMCAYSSALSIEAEHVESKVAMGALVRRNGKKWFCVARSYLTAALHSDPKNYIAWYNLGLLDEEEGEFTDAADCYQAAFLLEQASPVEHFSST